MSYCGLQKSKDMASGTTVDVFKKKQSIIGLGCSSCCRRGDTNEPFDL